MKRIPVLLLISITATTFAVHPAAAEVTTPDPGTPSAPATELKVSSIDGTSADFELTDPDSRGFPVRIVEPITVSANKKCEIDQTECTISGLKPLTDYVATVTVASATGNTVLSTAFKTSTVVPRAPKIDYHREGQSKIVTVALHSADRRNVDKVVVGCRKAGKDSHEKVVRVKAYTGSPVRFRLTDSDQDKLCRVIIWAGLYYRWHMLATRANSCQPASKSPARSTTQSVAKKKRNSESRAKPIAPMNSTVAPSIG